MAVGSAITSQNNLSRIAIDASACGRCSVIGKKRTLLYPKDMVEEYRYPTHTLQRRKTIV